MKRSTLLQPAFSRDDVHRVEGTALLGEICKHKTITCAWSCTQIILPLLLILDLRDVWSWRKVFPNGRNVWTGLALKTPWFMTQRCHMLVVWFMLVAISTCCKINLASCNEVSVLIHLKDSIIQRMLLHAGIHEVQLLQLSPQTFPSFYLQMCCVVIVGTGYNFTVT